MANAPTAELPTYLTDKELSAHCGISTLTLARWRLDGGGPPFVAFGPRAIRYRMADVEAWAAARTYPHLAAAREAAAHKENSPTCVGDRRRRA